MTIFNFIRQATLTLGKAGIQTARLDTLILLEDVTGKDRSWLLAHPEFVLQGVTLQKLQRMIERRAQHEPLAYIRGKSEFYGREFTVTKNTLQPRPETETMIDLLRKIVASNQSLANSNTGDRRQAADNFVVVDVGTGSGCLAITAKLEFPAVEVYATEINKDALKIAKQNAVKLEADIKFCQGNLLTPLSNIKYQISSIFVVLANLPYVPNDHIINKSALQEPPIAIFGGQDGLDLYRELFSQLSKMHDKVQFVLTESLPFQHEELANIASSYGFIQTETEDFIQLFCASP